VVGLEQHNHLKVDLEEQEDLEVEVFLEVPVIHLQQVLHKVIQEELQQESQKVELVVVEEELEQLDKMELHQKVVTEVQDQVVGQEIVH
jgi:DNA-binding transcriptional regulator YbjK